MAMGRMIVSNGKHKQIAMS